MHAALPSPVCLQTLSYRFTCEEDKLVWLLGLTVQGIPVAMTTLLVNIGLCPSQLSSVTTIVLLVLLATSAMWS